MQINKDTKISQLIKANPEAIEVIASINKQFRKLRNPVLRKLLAPRVSIADAAKIGGSSIDVFLKKLQGIGFEIDPSMLNIEENDIRKDNQLETNKNQLANMNISELDQNKIVSLDVRPTIESGSDPFKDILAAIKELPVDGILKIINSFEPVPMINHLKDKGYDSKTERTDTGLVHTYFIKSKGAKEDLLPTVEDTNQNDFEKIVDQYKGNIKTIDVRHLEMPEPMVTILQEVETLSTGHALFVHHKRIPQFLLPELKKRDFEIINNEVDENNMNLLIFKKTK